MNPVRRPEEFARVFSGATGHRAVHEQLAQGAHDVEDKRPGQQATRDVGQLVQQRLTAIFPISSRAFHPEHRLFARYSRPNRTEMITAEGTKGQVYVMLARNRGARYRGRVAVTLVRKRGGLMRRRTGPPDSLRGFRCRTNRRE